MNRKILIIDNYDSFTYNLVQFFGVLGTEISVFRNNHLLSTDIENMKPDGIVISPGPGAPKDAGVSMEIIRKYGPKVKLLGVCLGHQCIAEAYGGKVKRAKSIVHGKTTQITHDGVGVFAGIPSPIRVARYHSLVVDEESIPHCFEASAAAPDGTIMALRHKNHPVEGIQFHPESFMTEYGMEMLENFLSS